ncbi:MAG: dTDP-4-dehydrorhamnose reductase [Pirellulales bacterium]|nr:dTDP-4-dehydrorhamnose reductase [Pirellulales bacterium]
MKIVVTGAKGQLGGELCRQLDDKAVPLDIEELDLTDRDAVLRFMLSLRPAAIVNCAAYTQVDQAEREPDRARAVNAAAVEHLVEACRRLDCPLMQISTDYVFSTPNSRPYSEKDPPSPRGIYAQTKWEGERAAAAWPKHWIVRTCGLYARPGDARAKHFVKTMLRLASEKPELRIVADQHCTPSYVPHVARGLLFLGGLTGGTPAPWGLYHLTNRGATTWYEFAAEIFRRAGLNVQLTPITTAEYAAPAPRPAYSVLDTAKYHALGGPAMPDWKEALAEYLAEREDGRS